MSSVTFIEDAYLWDLDRKFAETVLGWKPQVSRKHRGGKRKIEWKLPQGPTHSNGYNVCKTLPEYSNKFEHIDLLMEQAEELGIKARFGRISRGLYKIEIDGPAQEVYSEETNNVGRELVKILIKAAKVTED